VKKTRKATPRRPEQVAETVRQLVSEVLVHGEIRDPRVGMVTVTSVKVAPDLGSARVWVALGGTKDEQKASLEGLRSAAGFLRSRLAKELTTYATPEFRFEQDFGAERGARVDALLAEIKRSGETPDPPEVHDQADGADGHE
jgi:ribosome-binding factor A